LQQRYRVERLIGQGGFGAVYEAVDLRLNRRIALKQLLRAGERLSRQFEREAQLLANLDHPSLPDVHDHFSTPDGQFLVMQYVPGDDLGTLLLEHDEPFPVDQVLGWAAGLLNVLHYLHTRQPPIVHRDIKPQNLKLQHDGTIMLLDFGLAKGFAGESPPSTAERSLLAYTKGYAPPEQVEGLGTDERSDLYGLGATLYSLLTNAAPVEAQTRLLAVARGRPDPLRPAHELNPAVPEDLSRVLEQAMQLERDDRPQTARAMRAMLEAARDGQQPASPVAAPLPAFRSEPTLVDASTAAMATTPTPAFDSQSTVVDASTAALPASGRPEGASPPPPSAPVSELPSGAGVSLPSQPSRWRLRLFVGGAALLVALAAVLALLFVARGGPAGPGIVAAASTQAAADPQASETQSEATGQATQPAETEPEPAGDPAAASEAPAESSTDEQADPADEIARHIANAEQAFSRPGGMDEAIAELEAAVEAHDESAELHTLLAIAYMQRFRWDDVASEAERAIELDGSSAVAHSVLSQARREQGELDQALADADKAIELDPELSLGYTARSYVHSARAEDSGDHSMLDAALSDADTAIRSAGDEDSYSQGEAHAAKASAFHTRYRLDGVEDDLQRAIEEYRQAIGGELQLGWHYANLGSLLSEAGRLDEAREALEQAIERDPMLYSPHEALGWMLYNQGEYDAAVDSFSQAIQLGAETATPDAYYGRALAHRANASVDGQDKEAELSAAYSDMGDAIELDNEEGWYWYELGAISKELFAESDPSHTSAFTALQTAISYFQAELERDANNADAREGLGWTHYELEEYDAAVSEFDAAIAIDPRLAAAYLGKGYALSADGDSQGACQALADGLSNRPGSTDATLEEARTALGCR